MGRRPDPPDERQRKNRDRQARWRRRYRRLSDAVPKVLAAKTLGEAKRIVREADALGGEGTDDA